MSDIEHMLHGRVAKLEATLNRLLESYSRTLGQLNHSIDGLTDLGLIRERECTDALVRIKQIEMHLFPGIDKDIQQVYQVTKSDTPPSDNPLDRRNPKKG